MTTLQIKKVKMQNFKCFKDKTIELSENTTITGKNASGKTTIIDAITWVLFDKVSDGTSANNIRPKNDKGEVTHFVDVSVTLDIEVNGKPVQLVKTNSEKWVKPRGQAEQEYSGNKNTYEVNGVPMGEKDYKAKIAEIISEEVFKYASMGSFFLNLDAKKQRQKLFELVENIDTAEVIASDSELEVLKDVLSNYSYDEAMALAKKEIKEGNAEIDDIPVRIDELEKSKIEGDAEQLKAKAEDIKAKIKELKDVTELEDNYRAVCRRKEQLIEEARLKTVHEKDEKRNDLYLLENIYTGIEKELIAAQGKLETLTTKIGYEEQRLEETRNKYLALVKEIPEVSDECPTCGRKLNKQDYERALKKATKAHRDEIEKCSTEGKALAAEVNELKTQKLNLEGKILKIEESMTDTEAKIDAAVKILDSVVPYTAETLDLDAEIERLEIKLQGIDRNQAGRYAEELVGIEGQIEKLKVNNTINARIAELTDRQKELAQIVATAEQKKYALELFNRKRVEMLTEGVNSHFKKINFVLFREQINGGIQEICEATVDGIGYGNGLNTGMCLLAEIDVATAFQKINEVNVPIFVDNAEALSENTTSEINTDCQMVYLKVAEGELEVK